MKIRDITTAKKAVEASLSEVQLKWKEREEKLLAEKLVIEKQLKVSQLQVMSLNHLNCIS